MSVASVSPSPGIIHLNKPHGSWKSLEILWGGMLHFVATRGASILRTFLK